MLLVPCPRQIQIPTNCSSGFSAYDSPFGCVDYQCNENLAAQIASDVLILNAALLTY
jgi:hypothetical protein